MLRIGVQAGIQEIGQAIGIDTNDISQLIESYALPDNRTISTMLPWLMFRIKNIALGIFGYSDWQKTRANIVDHLVENERKKFIPSLNDQTDFFFNNPITKARLFKENEPKIRNYLNRTFDVILTELLNEQEGCERTPLNQFLLNLSHQQP